MIVSSESPTISISRVNQDGRIRAARGESLHNFLRPKLEVTIEEANYNLSYTYSIYGLAVEIKNKHPGKKITGEIEFTMLNNFAYA